MSSWSAVSINSSNRTSRSSNYSQHCKPLTRRVLLTFSGGCDKAPEFVPLSTICGQGRNSYKYMLHQVTYDFPYRAQMPNVLLNPGIPYLASTLFDITYSPSADNDAPKAPETLYEKPYGLAAIVDDRLGNFQLSQWTNVDTEDTFLRLLLELYFKYEHTFFTAFDKDFFLEDLASGSTDFASDFLVNVVLALACVRPL